MIVLIVGCILVCLLLSGVSVTCFVMRRNRRNTKLVGVMGIGLPPKSMSIGLGLNGNCPSSDQISETGNTTKNCHKKPSFGGGSSSVTVGGKRMGKIALCDMNPVSISGETDSDESLYHELVFGRNGPSVIMGKS